MKEGGEVVDEVGDGVGRTEEVVDVDAKMGGQLNRLRKLHSKHAVGVLSHHELGRVVGVEVVVTSALAVVEVLQDTRSSVVDVGQ